MQAWRDQNFGGKATSRLLDEEINDMYLWHGTSYEAVRHIFAEDFKFSLTKPMGLFGAGLYFAESCAKADEYSVKGQHDNSWYKTMGVAEGTPPLKTRSHVYAMLLCRVVLGNPLIKNSRGNFQKEVGGHRSVEEDGKYDSLIGDREAHRREFILYSKEEVFPEFCVLYTREFAEAAPQRTESETFRSNSSSTLADSIRERVYPSSPAR